ncbi:tetraspanin-3-like [Protopterus annectens]|uniref:tetraspanin-3-like n=1 Tax=Protopterus annectens TaxID=7888 RepID=UPI001CFB49C0|nr:tetraspanin-3-like [Protopterus annectens]
MGSITVVICEKSRGIFSLFLWGGAVTMAIGSMFLLMVCSSYIAFFKDNYLTYTAWIAVSGAILLFLTGTFGLCMIAKDSQCQQGTFMFLIVVLICIEATSAVLAAAYTKRVAYELSSLDEKFNHYNGTGTQSDRDVDTLQHELRCCGVHNYTDWKSTTWYEYTANNSVPESCCDRRSINCTGNMTQFEFFYDQGCLTKLEHRVKLYLTYILWSSVAVLCLLVLAAMSNGILMIYSPEQDYTAVSSGTLA